MSPKSDSHKYVFGPVPSRRLGYSLGVDIVPAKTCNLNCVYCELGRTTRQTLERRSYVPMDEVLADIRKAVETIEQIDFITFTGSGEPTLNTDLGRMIDAVRAFTDIRIAVLTNGTLLYLPEVRRDLARADVVIPSLDAVTENAFRKVNRPHGRLNLSEIIEGLKQFRQEYDGQIWLEILFVKGLNDQPEHVRQLQRVVQGIRPDRVQLNTVVRPPAESNIEPVTQEWLEAVRRQIGGKAEVIASFQPHDHQRICDNKMDTILALVSRRPVTLQDIHDSLGYSEADIREVLDHLRQQGRIQEKHHLNRVYYFVPRQEEP